jgi:hypothetical protein
MKKRFAEKHPNGFLYMMITFQPTLFKKHWLLVIYKKLLCKILKIDNEQVWDSQVA